MDTVTEFIRKCIGDVVATVTIKTYPNQKPWIDCIINTKLKEQTNTFNHGKVDNALRITQCHRHGPLPRTVGTPSPWPT